MKLYSLSRNLSELKANSQSVGRLIMTILGTQSCAIPSTAAGLFIHSFSFHIRCPSVSMVARCVIRMSSWGMCMFISILTMQLPSSSTVLKMLPSCSGAGLSKNACMSAQADGIQPA